MNGISFYGRGGETSGSIGKFPVMRNNTTRNTDNSTENAINFRGRSGDYYEKSSPSAGSIVLGSLLTAGILIGGLGYAHKTDIVSKIKNDKVRNFLQKADVITKPCHDICSKVKNFGMETFEKIKNFFGKKD